MKLFFKILLFVFVTLVTNVKVASASISFTNIQKAITFYSFHRELPEIDFKVIKNDEANCSKNEQNLVDYRNWCVGVEAVAAKTVGKNFNKISDNLLKKSGIDAHQLKMEWLGDNAKIARYDLYKDTKTGEFIK